MCNNPLLKAEYGKIHAKLHKQISDALPYEDEDTREDRSRYDYQRGVGTRGRACGEKESKQQEQGGVKH